MENDKIILRFQYYNTTWSVSHSAKNMTAFISSKPYVRRVYVQTVLVLIGMKQNEMKPDNFSFLWV